MEANKKRAYIWLALGVVITIAFAFTNILLAAVGVFICLSMISYIRNYDKPVLVEEKMLPLDLSKLAEGQFCDFEIDDQLEHGVVVSILGQRVFVYVYGNKDEGQQITMIKRFIASTAQIEVGLLAFFRSNPELSADKFRTANALPKKPWQRFSCEFLVDGDLDFSELDLSNMTFTRLGSSRET